MTLRTTAATAVAVSLAGAASALAPSAALAQTKRDLDAHEHGAATLDAVIDGSTLFLEFESPWANLVGFEHEPSTDEQRAAVDEALGQLERAGELFALRGGDCTVAQASVSSTMGEAEHRDEDEHHDEDEHRDDEDEHHDDEDGHHDEEHDDEDGHEGEESHDGDAEHRDGDEAHAEDDHGHEDDDHAGGTHSELAASYAFECADIAALSAIEVTMLELFPDIEDLDVQLAGPGGQGAAELGGNARTIDLEGVR